jgi:hypothetical protein
VVRARSWLANERKHVHRIDAAAETLGQVVLLVAEVDRDERFWFAGHPVGHSQRMHVTERIDYFTVTAAKLLPECCEGDGG